jgi:hypothetical protein
MLVWGGATQRAVLADGAAYQPAPDSWTPIPEAPIGGRSAHVAMWDGTRMLVWGGCCDAEGLELFDGGGFDPATSTWQPLAQGPLAPRQLHTAVWTGDRIVIWGGRSGLDQYPPDVAAYLPAADAWTRMRRGPLVPRAGHTAVWTGDRMLVWGGCCTPEQEGYADGAELLLAAAVPSPAPSPTPSPATPGPPLGPTVAPSSEERVWSLLPAVLVGVAVFGLVAAVLVSRARTRRRG